MLIAISDFGQFSLIGVSENERPLFLINSLFGPLHNIKQRKIGIFAPLYKAAQYEEEQKSIHAGQ